ncbi:MAG TPA: glycosyltransferase [Bacteroidia bacterium]|nr:glycosyltransferase [Bacteroidia bacterium]
MKTSVLFMIHNMNVGGTEKSLLSLLTNIDKEKYEVTILMLEKHGGYLNSIPNWVKKEYVKGYNNMKPIVMNPPLQTIKTFIKQGELIKGFKTLFSYINAKSTSMWLPFYKQALKNYPVKSYDIAIAYAGPSDFITYFIAEKINAPKKLQWIHFDVLKIKLNTNFGKIYYPKFDIINCVSENSKKEMQQVFPKIKNNIKVFNNIVNTREIKELSKKVNSFKYNYPGIKIVTLGRLSNEKGQQMIPKVVEKLKNDGYLFKWYCIGEGILLNELKREIKEKKIMDELILLGVKINPYPFLKDCDIYVQTSLHEGYGLTLHEAKLFNKPIITTNFQTAKEQIIHNKTGLIVDITSEGLYNGIKNIIDNPDKQKMFSENLLIENNKLSSNKKTVL